MLKIKGPSIDPWGTLASMDSAKTTAIRRETLKFWDLLHLIFDGKVCSSIVITNACQNITSIAVIFHWFCRALFCFRYINSSWNQMCCHSTVFNTLALTRFYIGNWSGSRNAGHSLWQHPIVLHKFFLRNIHIIVTKGYIAQFRMVVSLQFGLVSISYHWYQTTLQWRHNYRDGVSNHQPHDYFSTIYSDTHQRKHQNSA